MYRLEAYVRVRRRPVATQTINEYEELPLCHHWRPHPDRLHMGGELPFLTFPAW